MDGVVVRLGGRRSFTDVQRSSVAAHHPPWTQGQCIVRKLNVVQVLCDCDSPTCSILDGLYCR